MKTTPTFLIAALLAASAVSAHAADFSPLKPSESISVIADKAQALGDAVWLAATRSADPALPRTTPNAAATVPESQGRDTYLMLLAGLGVIAAMSRRRLR
ncbi:hypothetical protein OPU71_06755 [Niveibacterium sp. 24ML]|uniref:hypothetical protein n=1 Tax=Niveibacterium sp. 24ML TaxID=2985512 RepID=UPI00226DF26B|nr:hypothetical protein [Niveibacterium sp. 24ML]MCX9155826.1 hypothetical protein [Niveibacterium sp. 24ML]